LTITRNPFGFSNKIKVESGYQGVANTKKSEKGETLIDTEYLSDDDFERRIISVLDRNGISVIPQGIDIKNKKALPDTFDLFEAQYIDSITKKIKNIDALKRRIVGLSSYFRSAQENLLPRYNKTLSVDYHIVRIPMSNFQFSIYEAARHEERKSEKKKPKQTVGEMYEESSSTYRIFSRLYCNFVMPERPIPQRSNKKELLPEEGEAEEGTLTNILKEARREETKQDVVDEQEGEVEGDQILEMIGGIDYKDRLNRALKHIEEHSNDFLTPEALQTYSPKFLHVLENIQDPENQGLHLVYSQFRTMEGIGIFSLTLDKNGFTQFKIKKNSSGIWSIDIDEVNKGKPTYACILELKPAKKRKC
jgi:hypothetical protein